MISLLHPSRGRAQKSFNNAKEWMDMAGCKTELILSIDDNDPAKEEYKKLYEDSFPYQEETFFCIDDNSCLVEATNKAARVSEGDILVYLSDDFKCYPNWGIDVMKEFEGETRPLLIKVDDCLQKFDIAVLTIPMMNRVLYNMLGYFFHPEYKSMSVDEDLFWTCQSINAIKMCPHLKFSHEHCSVGKCENDETYKRSAANWDQGREVFTRRKLAGFPI